MRRWSGSTSRAASARVPAFRVRLGRVARWHGPAPCKEEDCRRFRVQQTPREAATAQVVAPATPCISNYHDSGCGPQPHAQAAPITLQPSAPLPARRSNAPKLNCHAGAPPGPAERSAAPPPHSPLYTTPHPPQPRLWCTSSCRSPMSCRMRCSRCSSCCSSDCCCCTGAWGVPA